MTDMEMLELAAKAAGIPLNEFGDCENGDYWIDEKGTYWNPLEDDGDALRLAVKLDLVVHCGNWLARHPGSLEWIDGGRDEPCAAVRRAIVRAAADIGRNMT